MKFGTIGAGAVALAFARKALAAGHEVVLSSRRGPDSLGGKVAELGRGASAGTVEAAATLDYVLLAVPWPNVEDALRGLPAWNGRVLVDNKSVQRIQPESRAGRPGRQWSQRDSGWPGGAPASSSLSTRS